MYVSNLSPSIREDDLRSFFEAYGEVFSVQVVKNKQDGASRGFGFVEMEANSALDAMLLLQDAELCGQKLDLKAI